jgi:hypothetical protein
MVRFTLRPLYSTGKTPLVPIGWEVECEKFIDEKNILPISGIETKYRILPARSRVTVLRYLGSRSVRV